MFHDEFRYLPVSQRDREWGLFVTGAGFVRDARPDSDWSAHPEPYSFGWEEGRRVSDLYTAMYLPHSSLELESEATSPRVVSPGSFIVLCPGVWHRYRATQEPRYAEYWVWFGGSYADHLVRTGFLSPKEPVCQVGADAGLLAGYRRLLDHLRAAPPSGLAQLLAANVMEILGIAVTRANARRAIATDEAIVRQAQGIMEQEVEKILNVRQLASSLGFGYHQFRRAFKQIAGVAPYQYHLQLRIHRAKQLLVETELSVKEIANSLNFDSPYHFSRTFRQHAGTAPSDWRNRIRHTDRSRE